MILNHPIPQNAETFLTSEATHKKTLLHIVKLHPHLHIHSTYSVVKLHGVGKTQLVVPDTSLQSTLPL
jgi:hypothetical protein